MQLFKIKNQVLCLTMKHKTCLIMSVSIYRKMVLKKSELEAQVDVDGDLLSEVAPTQ